MLVAVGLTGGGFAIFESRSEIVRVFGLPVGFWIGVIGAVIGIIAVRAIMREARPLQALAGAVQSFAVDAKPVTIVPAGARETKALVAAINDMQAKIAQSARKPDLASRRDIARSQNLSDAASSAHRIHFTAGAAGKGRARSR